MPRCMTKTRPSRSAASAPPILLSIPRMGKLISHVIGIEDAPDGLPIPKACQNRLSDIFSWNIHIPRLSDQEILPFTVPPGWPRVTGIFSSMKGLKLFTNCRRYFLIAYSSSMTFSIILISVDRASAQHCSGGIAIYLQEISHLIKPFSEMVCRL